MPKGNFRDSGLAMYLQRIDEPEHLLSNSKSGFYFGSFVIEEIIKGVQSTTAVGWDYRYFRTKNGAEVDLILDGRFGLLPIEIKMSSSSRQSDLKGMTRFLNNHNIPLGMVVNFSIKVEMIKENIIQIPVGLL